MTYVNGRSPIERSLQKALIYAGDTHDLYDDVGPALESGRAQYWHNDDAAIVTEINVYPKLKAVNFWLVAGELEAALALAPSVEAWARRIGCSRAIAVGRRGWQPFLEPRGWRARGTAYAKELRA